jgi:hypothetical protein
MRRGLTALAVVALLGAAAVTARGSDATFRGLNGRIVLQGAEEQGSEFGVSNLYAFRMDAYGYFVQLTKGKWHDANPSWSPDGKWLAFNSNR